ncbi:hypothetical protein AB0I10_24370 [Streptomyces sp. NPDC050636]|uniref:hypothetical protein n=1 Tax=Streptomyces sp. NPDC050636 TaxID=3154510 RepID=UPI0034171766
MEPVPNGVCAIARPGEQLLTLQGGSPPPGTPVALLRPTGNPGEQEWRVAGLGNGTCTIRSLSSETYLGFEGEPEPNKPIRGFPEPCEWALHRSSSPRTLYIAVPGSPIDGPEFVVDLSLLKIFPPRIALRPLDVDNPHQAWTFEFHE